MEYNEEHLHSKTMQRKAVPAEQEQELDDQQSVNYR